MQHVEPPSAAFDELTYLEFRIARRADELMREANDSNSTRDFWREAEEEVWEARPHFSGRKRPVGRAMGRYIGEDF